ncbi:hypothetical protein KVR01_006984 [Diaporthe batatas]|uniref:uncharacterized protein n=1 Tax=Diaporthe batatas TaxID=748121 RepID=UPI001D0466D8|nr:uncharacterized protein KVR01_006984 [Diaporthe batatas]KAG8163687.1 hypothetical protein KVR01_006984 [Diaporthe batatas]
MGEEPFARPAAGVSFGRAMRNTHFLIEPAYVNLNHGSFGSTVRPVRDAMRAYQDASEQAPDRYIRYEYPRLLDASRHAAAAHLRVDPDELVLVANATTAVNAVLRNLAPRWVAGDVVLFLDTVYGATRKTIDWVVDTSPAESVCVDFSLPSDSHADILDAFRAAFAQCARQGKRVRVAVLETIPSLPGVRLPFEEMNRIAQAEGALTLVDGAHAIGHFPFDLSSLSPDFFTSNCHKWLYTPRGCAILYVPLRNQHLMRSSLPTSHWYEPLSHPQGAGPTPNPLPPSTKSNFVQQFEFVGTVDNASLLCVPAALQFRRDVCGGEDAIMRYCWDLAARGGALAASILGTEVMDDAGGGLRHQCAMVMVRMPLEMKKNNAVDGEGNAAPRIQSWMSEEMVSKHGTFIAIVFYQGQWWARFSAQIYLELSDFEWGAGVLKQLCAEAAVAFPELVM